MYKKMRADTTFRHNIQILREEEGGEHGGDRERNRPNHGGIEIRLSIISIETFDETWRRRNKFYRSSRPFLSFFMTHHREFWMLEWRSFSW